MPLATLAMAIAFLAWAPTAAAQDSSEWYGTISWTESTDDGQASEANATGTFSRSAGAPNWTLSYEESYSTTEVTPCGEITIIDGKGSFSGEVPAPGIGVIPSGEAGIDWNHGFSADGTLKRTSCDEVRNSEGELVGYETHSSTEPQSSFRNWGSTTSPLYTSDGGQTITGTASGACAIVIGDDCEVTVNLTRHLEDPGSGGDDPHPPPPPDGGHPCGVPGEPYRVISSRNTPTQKVSSETRILRLRARAPGVASVRGRATVEDRGKVVGRLRAPRVRVVEGRVTLRYRIPRELYGRIAEAVLNGHRTTSKFAVSGLNADGRTVGRGRAKGSYRQVVLRPGAGAATHVCDPTNVPVDDIKYLTLHLHRPVRVNTPDGCVCIKG
jgi:hypothetical protein